MTLEELQAALDTLDDGVLRAGAHPAGGREFCALEFESQVRGRKWSDEPITLPDLRPLNDATWPNNEARTKALLPVMVAFWDWSEWSPERRSRWYRRVVFKTTKELIARLPFFENTTLPPLESFEKCAPVGCEGCGGCGGCEGCEGCGGCGGCVGCGGCGASSRL